MAGGGQTLRSPRIPGGAPVRWFRRHFSRSTIFRGGAYNLLRILLGLLLLSATGFKAHQPATEPALGSALLNSGWCLIGVPLARAPPSVPYRGAIERHDYHTHLCPLRCCRQSAIERCRGEMSAMRTAQRGCSMRKSSLCFVEEEAR